MSFQNQLVVLLAIEVNELQWTQGYTLGDLLQGGATVGQLAT